jgi:hypothetical protein
MIVSHRHRFIFTAIPKTGTHSVRQALRTHLGSDDLEQVRLFVEKRFPFPELAKIGHGHIGLSEVRHFLGEETFGSYWKFAFVRNPFDRFVSYCAFATSREGSFLRDPQGVMRYFLFEAPPHHHMVFRPQYSFISDADGAPLTDQLGRVEDMQGSYDAICAKLGIASEPLERANASRHGDYRSYYDQQLIDGVAKLYARDLELFGYEF